MSATAATSRDRLAIEYIHWLEDRVKWNERYPGSTVVARAMHAHPFKWTIPNDDNRGFDGLDIRLNWWKANAPEEVPPPPTDWCSMLEMMVALAMRMEDEILYDSSKGDRVADWFWMMMDNIGLSEICDEMYEEYMLDGIYVDHILGTIVSRTYLPNGVGGLFPLANPQEDQRGVEIWFQMQSYLNEHPEIE